MGKKRTLTLALMFFLSLLFPAHGEMTVERQCGEDYFYSEKDQKNWVYHFVYAYPRMAGEDYTAALINDTYERALSEWRQLALPMFANAPDMYYDGQNEVIHDFTVVCNNGVVLSVLQTRSQTRGSEGTLYVLEPLTFDVSGPYAGETLTLRGVTLLQGGVAPEKLEEAQIEDYPALANILSGSSTLMGEALADRLYPEFLALQEAGVLSPALTREDYEAEFSPARDFYTDDENNLVFFFPPALMQSPSFQPPVFSFTPEELNALLSDACKTDKT